MRPSEQQAPERLGEGGGTVLLAIHGVGDFSEVATIDPLRRVVKMLAASALHVQGFNWAKAAGDVIGDSGLIRSAWIQSVGLGMVTASGLGSANEARQLHLSLNILQLLTASWFPLLSIALVLNLAYSRVMLWLVWGTLCVHFVVLATDVISTRAHLSIVAAIRRHALHALWPIVQLCSLIGLLEFAVGVGIVAVGYVLVLFGLSGVLVTLLILAGLAVVALIVTRVLSPLFKILGDIFRWIGLPAYRERILRELELEFAKVARSRPSELYVVAHSLGSVIAVDGLLRTSASLPRVTLITMGSPLKRYFYRWFPGHFEAPAELAQALASRLPDFSWFNVYRPCDPVGTRLNRRSDDASPIIEWSTGQWHLALRGGLPAHINYWGDPLVVGAIIRARAQSTAAPPRRHKVSAVPSFDRITNPCDVGLSRAARVRAAERLARWWFLILVSSAAIVVVSFFMRDPKFELGGAVLIVLALSFLGLILSVPVFQAAESIGLNVHPFITWFETALSIEIGDLGEVRSDVERSVLASYVGQYAIRNDLTVTISLEQDTLILAWPGQAKTPLYPVSSSDFYFQSDDKRFDLSFKNDAGTESLQMVLKFAAGNLAAPRVWRPKKSR